MSTRLKNFPSKRISKHLVLFKDYSGKYRKTYNTRIYFNGQRKFVLWDGMICWLRKSYRNHYVVWTMQSPDIALA